MQKIARDGHCVFQAFATLNSEGTTEQRETLRAQAATYVAQHFEHFKLQLQDPNNPTLNNNVNEYMERMIRTRDQGDEPEIIALGTILKADIIILTLDERNKTMTKQLTLVEPTNTKTFHLIYVGKNHYHIAREKEKSTPPTQRSNKRKITKITGGTPTKGPKQPEKGKRKKALHQPNKITKGKAQ